MTRNDYEYAKTIFDKMFYMQVFRPEEMKKAFRCLFGEEPANVQQARARVAAYFRFNVTPEFSDETISVSNEGQSHQEDDNKIFKEVIVGGIDKDNPILEKTMEEFISDVKESGWLEDSQRENSPNGDNEIIKPKRKRNKK